MGIDPHTAFTVWPWDTTEAIRSLQDDTLIAGWNMPTYLLNADWSTYGQVFTVTRILPPTGTGLDNTMLMTMSAARKLARARVARQRQDSMVPASSLPQSQPQWQGEQAPDAVTAVLMRTVDGVNLQQMGVQLAAVDSGIEVVTAPAYVQTLRRHMRQVQGGLAVLSTLTLVLGACVGVVALKPRRTGTLYTSTERPAAIVTRADSQR